MARFEDPLSGEDATAAPGGDAVIAALRAENALLRSEITLLMARIAELERRLCGTQTRAAFPQGVAAPVQYGKRINAIVLYLLHYQLLPEKRLSE